MRGKRQYMKFETLKTRITPADAGKTQTAYGKMQYHKDHPRGCGENARSVSGKARHSGSPPRMRGKLIHAVRSIAIRRITPADAGKTYNPQIPDSRIQDHPRGCGENLSYPILSGMRTGSPPRMRGKLEDRVSQHNHLRITPADAGKTVPCTESE